MQHPCHTSLGKRDRDARIQNTIDDPLFLPPIDIVIPFPSIPHYFDTPKFFPIEIPIKTFLKPISEFMSEVRELLGMPSVPENFSPNESAEKFFYDCYVPEIFVSQNSLENQDVRFGHAGDSSRK